MYFNVGTCSGLSAPANGMTHYSKPGANGRYAWEHFHVIMAIVCLDLTNKAVQEMEDGMVVGKEIVIVCQFI